VNLIEGRYHEVVKFLDRLTYGDRSTPGIGDTLAQWRANIAMTVEAWSDQKLKQIIGSRDTLEG
jgi:hypothetical protein